MDNNNYKHQNKLKGNFGEDYAAVYLQKAGWQIVERNWRFSRYSEIDIIAKDDDTYVFVEVKLRTNASAGHPFEAIDSSKLRKIRIGASKYMTEICQDNTNGYRIDAIAVIGTKNPKIEHLRNITL